MLVGSGYNVKTPSIDSTNVPVANVKLLKWTLRPRDEDHVGNWLFPL